MNGVRQGPTPLLAALVFAAVAWLVVSGLTPYGAATSPDSLRYLEVAGNLAAGEGLVIRNPMAGPRLVPFTTYGPAYPAALSLMLRDDVPPERSAARLSVVAMAISGLLVFLLLAPAGRGVAFVGALAFQLTQPSLAIFTYAWSESIAMPLAVGSAVLARRVASVGSEDDDGVGLAVPLAALVVTMGLLVWTRYAALLLCVILPWTWWTIPHRKRWTFDFAAASVGLVGIVGALAIRNWRLTGHLSGAEREPTTSGLFDNLYDLLAAFHVQTPATAAGWIVAALAAAGITVFTILRPDRRAEPEATARTLVLSALAASVYLAGLVLLRTFRHFDAIDTRFIGLSFPFVIVVLTLLAVRSTVVIRAVASFILALFVVQGVTQFAAASSSWALESSPRFPLTHETIYTNHTLPGRILLWRAERLIEQGRYLEAVLDLEGAPGLADEVYPLARALATGYAGTGDAGSSLVMTRRLMQMDSERAPHDVVAISQPFWDDPERYQAGITYYQGLLQDLPEAGWLHENIAGLATRRGDLALAAAARSRAAELESK